MEKLESDFKHIFTQGTEDETALLLHGTGGDEHDLIPLAQEITPGLNILSPRGRVNEQGMNRWFARHSPGVLDFEDVRRRSAELKNFVEQAAKAYDYNLKKVWAIGFSNGANIAAACLLLYPQLFAGAILLRPMLPLDKAEAVQLGQAEIYLAAGLQDELIPKQSTEELIELLQKSSAKLSVNWANAGHRFGMEEIAELRAWFAQRKDQASSRDNP